MEAAITDIKSILLRWQAFRWFLRVTVTILVAVVAYALWKGVTTDRNDDPALILLSVLIAALLVIPRRIRPNFSPEAIRKELDIINPNVSLSRLSTSALNCSICTRSIPSKNGESSL